MAVLGFEHGYSLEDPNVLVLWEGQFGDFANGAQVIIDQFICSGEQKWQRMSGLVLLLPHGYEGQGPEHSSGRVERYLQQCDDNPDEFWTDITKQAQVINIQVINATTPANYFHALRRQIHREYRKPLVVMTPKSLLTLRACQSKIEDFSTNSEFKRLIPETSNELVPTEQIRKLILCTGKVYYDLINERNHKKIKDVAIVRVEQLAPFPYDLVKEQGDLYSNAHVLGVQEEPMNMGAWTYVAPRIETSIRTSKRRPSYVGRQPSAAPATGIAYRHKIELEEFMTEAFK